MAGPILNTCCKFNSLATGSIVSGVFGILLAIASLIVLFTVRVEFRTIVFDWFPSSVVKIILAINLCMTIFISILLIVGVVKVHYKFSKRNSARWFLRKSISCCLIGDFDRRVATRSDKYNELKAEIVLRQEKLSFNSKWSICNYVKILENHKNLWKLLIVKHFVTLQFSIFSYCKFPDINAWLYL